MSDSLIEGDEIIVFSHANNVTYPASVLNYTSLVRHPNGANRSDTTPTGTALVNFAQRQFGAGAPSAGPFIIKYANISKDNTVTFVAGTGVTLVGVTTVSAGSGVAITVTFTGPSTCTWNSVTSAAGSAETIGKLFLLAAGSQIVFQPGGTGNTLTLTMPSVTAGNRVITLPDPGSDASVLLSTGDFHITGQKIFDAQTFFTAAPMWGLATGGAARFNVSADNVASDRNLNFYDFGPAGTLSADILTGYARTVAIAAGTGSQSVTAAQSGCVIRIPQVSTNVIISLPAVANGLQYRFVVTATSNGANTCTIQAAAAVLQGHRIGVAAGLVLSLITNQTNLVLSATAANVKPGDYANLVSDGTNWYVTAMSGGTANGWSTS